MLYPRTNAFRQVIDLSGFWDFRFDTEDRGKSEGWHKGFSGGRPIAVPASWNDQLEEGRDFLGPAWYRTGFSLPDSWKGSDVLLRFDSVNYIAEAWLNGELLGSHEGGHLPFQFEVGRLLAAGNTLVVRVDGRLAPDRVPPGNSGAVPPDAFATIAHPAGMFDFFPFCGIQRPVTLSSVPRKGLQDIRVATELSRGKAAVRVLVTAPGAQTVHLRLSGHGAPIEVSARPAEDASLEVRSPALWEPGSPNLYDLSVECLSGGAVYDSYSLKVGIRSIVVEGDKLLLNGRPVHLKGFGRHEDFPVTGRGYFPPVVVKDYALMEWVGANSFRTTHYPYSEQMMELADRLGFLVIDETPAVGLFFSEGGLSRRLELCRSYVRELIARDSNHPSVIAWSLANEPHSSRPEARTFFKDLYDLAKELDGSRPATIASYIGVGEEAFEFLDLVCLNRYFGWYSEPGRIADGAAKLSEELDRLHTTYKKPVILTEFGADTVAGCHALEPEMFSEEYQAEFMKSYISVLRSKPFVVGEHVWNLCDFKTSQDVKRFGGLNLKGVFTRDRRPKMAAYALRELWKGGA
jgi:beta-glucuronidase